MLVTLYVDAGTERQRLEKYSTLWNTFHANILLESYLDCENILSRIVILKAFVPMAQTPCTTDCSS